MNAPDDLRELAALLHNDPLPEALSAERQLELVLKGVVAALEEVVLAEPAVQKEPPAQAAQSADQEPVGSPAIVLLHETAAVHPLESVRAQAFQALLRLAQSGRPAAVDALYQLAVEEELLGARQAIITQGWQPSRPELLALFDWFTCLETGRPYPEEGLSLLTRAFFGAASPLLRRRLLATAGKNLAADWALIVAAVQSGAEQALIALADRYPLLRPGERAIALEQLTRLADNGSLPARVALSSLYLRYEDPRAREIIIARNYLPEDAAQRALFFFLAQEWEKYQALDFDHNLLINAYEQAGRPMRRRLLELSRHTGQMDWLRGLGTTGEVRWLGDLTDADWELVLRRLGENDRLSELWRLAQFAPPLWSAAILVRLAKQGWQPVGDDEQAGFTALAEKASDCLAAPLSIKPTKALHGPLSDITCLAMHPGGRILAAGSSDARVYLWSLPDGSLREPPLISPVPVTRAMTFSLDGELLVCAAGDNRIRAFRINSGQVIKTFEGHRAMIRGLAVHPDGRMLYSAGFDGTLRFWRFPHGVELKVLRPGPGEIFGMALGMGGTHLLSGGAGGEVTVWTLPEGAAARELVGHAGTVTYLAASPTSELVASTGRDGTVRLWNYSSGGLVRTMAVHEPITGLVMHPNDQVLFCSCSSGMITIWNLSTGRMIEQLGAHHQPVTGLALSPDGSRLYSADSSAVLRAWDLRTFLSIRLAGEVARPGAETGLRERLQTEHLSPAEKKWLEFSAELARWRQRFDIELAGLETIQVGEFDIELT